MSDCRSLLKKPRANVKRCIQSCRRFLHHFLRLAQNQNFQPWHWSWPGQHQPLHSTLALITELEEFPDDPLAGETRKLVDLAILMCEGSRNGGITSNEGEYIDSRLLDDGGFEAWKYIRKARDEVWEKCGLDSNALYCPESAEAIHLESLPHTDNEEGITIGLPSQGAPEYIGPDTIWPSLLNAPEPFWPDDLVSGTSFDVL